MRILELFAGTHSIGRAFSNLGWDVISLDIDPKSEATITADLLQWDYTVFPKDHFDFIWGSPPCTMYSVARTTAKTPRDFVLADALVAKVQEIAAYFQPRLGYTFENPQTGLLKRRAVVDGINWIDTTYCIWGSPVHQYQKKTRLWVEGCMESWQSRSLCTREDPCGYMIGRRHPASAQRLTREGYTANSVNQLYSMPPELCNSIASCLLYTSDAADE